MLRQLETVVGSGDLSAQTERHGGLTPASFDHGENFPVVLLKSLSGTNQIWLQLICFFVESGVEITNLRSTVMFWSRKFGC